MPPQFTSNRRAHGALSAIAINGDTVADKSGDKGDTCRDSKRATNLRLM